jgi:hypothetical protein
MVTVLCNYVVMTVITFCLQTHKINPSQLNRQQYFLKNNCFQVVYSIQELDGDDNMFSITTVNGKGIIRLIGQLDYEHKFLYQLRVMAVDRSNNERVRHTILLELFCCDICVQFLFNL